MHIVTLDKQKRVRIPGAKAGEVFDYEHASSGVITLTPVKKADAKKRFPRGSLKYLCTPAKNKQREEIAAGTIMGVPKGYGK
jgi:hypothetical protein